MPFSDVFSIANPFSVNPQYSNTPQAAQAKAAQVKARTPETATPPSPATAENSSGAETLSAARTSPLMEALSSRASPSTSSTPSVTVNPAATGTNQLPGWIQSQLQSGKISEYTNPNTNQTFYAPHTINNSNQIWVSGPGGAGPINQTVGGQSIQVTSPTATISQGNNVIYTGSSSHAPSLNFTPKGAFQGFGKVQSSTPTTPLALNTPAVDYATFGNSAQINWVDPNLGTYYLTLSLPNRETFNYGSKTNPMQVYGVILGSQEAKDAAVDAAWNAYINGATQALNSQGSGSTATTLQGPNGLTLSVTPGANTYGSYSPSPKTSYQSVLIAPGYSLSLPTTLESGGVSVNVNWAQNPSGGFTPNPVSYQFSDGSQTTTVNPQSSGALKSIEALGYSAAQAQSLLNSAGTQSLTFNIDSATGAISGNVGALSSTSPLFNVNYSAMPITAPTFSTSSGTPNIILPQGWSTDSSGNLYVNGNAPTLQQSEQYANAYAGYLNWYQATSPSSTSSSTNQATTPPSVPNWYTTLSQSSSPSSGIYLANLAALQYAPIVATTQFDEYAQSLGLTPQALTANLQSSQKMQQQKANGTLVQTPTGTIYMQGTSNPSLNVTASQSMPVNAFSSQSISPSNTPIALSMPGTVGQSALPITSLSFLGSNQINNQLATIPPYSQSNTQSVPNTNTSQNSSWLSAIEGYPGDIASTAGNLANWLMMPLGYTPGGAPTAGGQFPYNYPYNQSGINNLAKTNPNISSLLQNQYNQLQQLSTQAYPTTMPNAAYTYLGSPSPSGDVLSYLTSPGGELKQGAEELGLIGGGALIAAAPAAAATSSLLGAGLGATLNPGITYVLSGGRATPKQLAQSSAQGLVFGGAAGSVMPGVNNIAESIIGKSLLARAGLGAATNIGFTNAYNIAANGAPAPLSSDLLAGGLGAGIPVLGDTFKLLKYQLGSGYLRPTDILSQQDIYGQRPTIYELDYATPTQETSISNQYGLSTPFDYLNQYNLKTDVNGFPLKAVGETPYSVTLPDGSVVKLDFPTGTERVLTPRLSYDIGETNPSTDYIKLYNDLAAGGKQLQLQAAGEPSYTDKIPLLTSLRDVKPEEISITSRPGDISNVQSFGSETPRPILKAVPDYRAAVSQFIKAVISGNPLDYPTELPMKEVPIGTYQAFYNSPEGDAMKMISGTTSNQGSLVPGSENIQLAQGYGTLPESPLEYQQYAIYNTLANRLRVLLGLEPIPVQIGEGVSTATGENTQVGDKNIIQFQRGVTPVGGQLNVEYRQNIDLPSKQTIPLELVENSPPGMTALKGEVFTPYSDTGIPINKFITSSLDNPYSKYIASGLQGPIAGNSYLPGSGLNNLPDFFDLQGKGIQVQAPSGAEIKPFVTPSEEISIPKIESFTPDQYLQNDIRNGLKLTFGESNPEYTSPLEYPNQGYNVPNQPPLSENLYPTATQESINTLRNSLEMASPTGNGEAVVSLQSPQETLPNSAISKALLTIPGIPEEIMHLPPITENPSSAISTNVVPVSSVSHVSSPKINTIPQPSAVVTPNSTSSTLITSPIPTSTLLNDVSTAISDILKTSTSLPLQEIDSIAPKVAYNLEPRIANAINQAVNENQSLGMSNNFVENLANALNENMGVALSENLAQTLGLELSQQLALQLSLQLAQTLALQLVEVLPSTFPIIIPGNIPFSPGVTRKIINPYEAYANIYSPSLLPEVMPSLEKLAEQEYSPLTALSTIRPLRAPSSTTSITLPPYTTPKQPTIIEENLPGTSNYAQARSTPMPHVISPTYSFNQPFSNAPAATQASPITDPALLRAVSTSANPLSLGNISPTAPQSAYRAIANPILQALGKLNTNTINLPKTNPRMGVVAPIHSSHSQPSAPAFGFAGYSAPRVGNISLIPTPQDIMSVLGPNQMLRLLNQVDPTKFSVTNIQYAPKATLASALNNLSYSDIVLLMSEMSVPQRMMVYGLLGIPPGEALVIAESGDQGLVVPSLSNALASTTRKKIATPTTTSTPSIININPPMTSISKQLVTV